MFVHCTVTSPEEAVSAYPSVWPERGRWYWHLGNSETCHGPYDGRADAVDDALAAISAEAAGGSAKPDYRTAA